MFPKRKHLGVGADTKMRRDPHRTLATYLFPKTGKCLSSPQTRPIPRKSFNVTAK